MFLQLEKHFVTESETYVIENPVTKTKGREVKILHWPNFLQSGLPQIT